MHLQFLHIVLLYCAMMHFVEIVVLCNSLCVCVCVCVVVEILSWFIVADTTSSCCITFDIVVSSHTAFVTKCSEAKHRTEKSILAENAS